MVAGFHIVFSRIELARIEAVVAGKGNKDNRFGARDHMSSAHKALIFWCANPHENVSELCMMCRLQCWRQRRRMLTVIFLQRVYVRTSTDAGLVVLEYSIAREGQLRSQFSGGTILTINVNACQHRYES